MAPLFGRQIPKTWSRGRRSASAIKAPGRLRQSQSSLLWQVYLFARAMAPHLLKRGTKPRAANHRLHLCSDGPKALMRHIQALEARTARAYNWPGRIGQSSCIGPPKSLKTLRFERPIGIFGCWLIDLWGRLAHQTVRAKWIAGSNVWLYSCSR